MRVVAGRFGGRTIVAPPGAGTRPTSDRVREALFSILGGIHGAKVLDLYAGTGALGIEALSRGASHVTFVERARPALLALRKNLTSLGLEAETTVLPIPVERALSTIPWGKAAFNLIFMDPPYVEVRGGAFSKDLAKAVSLGLRESVCMEGNVVLEHSSADEAPPIAGLAFVETRTYGDSALSFYVG